MEDAHKVYTSVKVFQTKAQTCCFSETLKRGPRLCESTQLREATFIARTHRDM